MLGGKSEDRSWIQGIWNVWVRRSRTKVRGKRSTVTRIQRRRCCSLSKRELAVPRLRLFVPRGSRKTCPSFESRLFFPLDPLVAKVGKKDRPFPLPDRDELPTPPSRSGVAVRDNNVSLSSVPELGSLSRNRSGDRFEFVLCISIPSGSFTLRRLEFR